MQEINNEIETRSQAVIIFLLFHPLVKRKRTKERMKEKNNSLIFRSRSPQLNKGKKK